MATYKVLQDIEAEDKLVGPFTLWQFIYLFVAGLCGYLGFLSVAKNVPVFLILLLPVALLRGFWPYHGAVTSRQRYGRLRNCDFF